MLLKNAGTASIETGKHLFNKFVNNTILGVLVLILTSLTVADCINLNFTLATPETSTDEQEFIDFIPYENSTFGVYADYPSDWEVIIPTNEKGSRILQVIQFWSPDGTGLVSISRDIFDTEESVNTYLAETIQSYRNSLSNFTLLSSDTLQTTLADNPGYGLIYSYNEAETGLTFLANEIGTIIPGTDIAYYVEYNAPLRYYANNEKTANQILDSLEFHIQLPKTEINAPPELGTDQSTSEVGEI